MSFEKPSPRRHSDAGGAVSTVSTPSRQLIVMPNGRENFEIDPNPGVTDRATP